MSSLKQRVVKLEALSDAGTPGRVVLVRSNGASGKLVAECIAASDIGFRPGIDKVAHLSLVTKGSSSDLHVEIVSALPSRLRHG